MNEWISDFEKLLAKCAVDENYRTQLATALAANNNDEAITLLTNLGVDGGNPNQRSARLSALKSALGPIETVIGEFTGSGRGELAP